MSGLFYTRCNNDVVAHTRPIYDTDRQTACLFGGKWGRGDMRAKEVTTTGVTRRIHAVLYLIRYIDRAASVSIHILSGVSIDISRYRLIEPTPTADIVRYHLRRHRPSLQGTAVVSCWLTGKSLLQ